MCHFGPETLHGTRVFTNHGKHLSLFRLFHGHTGRVSLWKGNYGQQEDNVLRDFFPLISKRITSN